MGGAHTPLVSVKVRDSFAEICSLFPSHGSSGFCSGLMAKTTGIFTQ